MFFFLLFLSLILFADQEDYLVRDLERVKEINEELDFSLPYISNYSAQGGYFTMPSARMRESGYFNAMFSSLSPYHIYALSFQLYDRLELLGSYWVFKGVKDPILGDFGFGDSADRTASFRFSLLNEKDGFELLPEIVFGANDFAGSKRFCSYYVVGTKQFKDYLTEVSLGWGSGRINGFFGGISFSPFAKEDSSFKDFSFIAEYDANDYKHHKEEHPKGREVNYPINIGAQINFTDLCSFKVSTIRGKEIAYSFALQYNLGKTKSLLGKKFDPLPYRSPVDHEAVGLIRKDRIFSQEMTFAFQKQGLDLYEIRSYRKCLWLKVVNQRYYKESEVRFRLETLLSALTPENYETVTAVIETDGVAVQQHTYRVKDLYLFEQKRMSRCVLNTISPKEEVEPFFYQNQHILFHRRKKIWNVFIRPQFFTFYGSSNGKFKYDLSLMTNLQGYLFDSLFYQFQANYNISSSSQDVGSCDFLNPSQIINVRTDKIIYFQQNSYHIQKLYLQKAFSFQSGFFTRLSLGYFEYAYGGGCLEVLYYPTFSNFAIGFEGALLRKRNYSGMRFTDVVRKFNRRCPEYVSLNYVLQYFLDLYYQNNDLLIDAKVSIGQFLARDKGARFEFGRNFCNGLRLYFWYTLTNGGDVVNRQRYYDKGVGFSLPIELLTCKSSTETLGFGMAAWLRDVGARAETGKRLYETVNSLRRPY